MFTGIISAIGTIIKAEPIVEKTQFVDVGGKKLTIQVAPGYLDDVVLGDSIALNGACMTVTSFNAANGVFTVDISTESLRCTVGLDQANRPINLEKAMQLNDRLGGHLVTGHVDGIGTVVEMTPVQESWMLTLMAPFEIGRFLAYKGSVVVNGVSLTVNKVEDIANQGTQISINLIPHTVEHTTLGELKTGAKVNLEIDLVARYLERMFEAAKYLKS